MRLAIDTLDLHQANAFNLIRRLQSSPYLYTVFAAASLSQIKCSELYCQSLSAFMARAVAPRCCAANANAAVLMAAHRGASVNRARTALASAAVSATHSAAPASIASLLICSKLNVCGPMLTGVPSAQASTKFCPPNGSRLPPIKAQFDAA